MASRTSKQRSSTTRPGAQVEGKVQYLGKLRPVVRRFPCLGVVIGDQLWSFTIEEESL